MNKKLITDNDFSHCLRTQIYPDEFYQERIDSIIKFCLECGFKNVILMFNAEAFNVGHITKTQLKPWIDVMKDAKKQLNEVGITVSLNPWIEIGHLDRGRKLQAGQNFTNMVDKNGKACELVACPLDSEWRKYYIDLMSYYVKEIEPVVLWIEDDFRLHNHEPLEWGGCFCDLHMKEYSKKLGRDISREDFVKALTQGPSKERDAWMEVSFETMDNLAKEISKTIKSLNVETSVGLMSSTPEMHAMEGRHWNKLLNDLSSDGITIDRIHLPMYDECGSKTYYHNFNRNPMVVRAFIGDDTLVYPEMENGCFSEFVKSPRMVAFEVESAIPLGLAGMTYSMFEFCGNGCQEEIGYGPALKEITPYLNTVKSLGLKPSQLRGLVFPIDEMTMKNRKTNKDEFMSLLPDDFDAISYFSDHGYSYSLSKDKSFSNKTVMLAGQSINNFSNDEIKELFKSDNFIVLDGWAAKELIDRGLGSLISAHSYEYILANTGVVSVETQVEPYKGMHNYHTCMEKASGDYVSIHYDENLVDIKSYVCRYDTTRVGAGVVEGSNFFVLPIVCKGLPFEQYSVLRIHQLLEASKRYKGEFIKSNHQGIYPYLYQQDDRKIIVLVNATVDNYDKTVFYVNGFDINSIEVINRDSVISKVKFTKNSGEITINLPLKYMSTMTLIVK